MRLLGLFLATILLAGCAAPAATPSTVGTRGAHVSVENVGRTPVDATLTWRTTRGDLVRQETPRLLPGEKIERDFVPPSVSTYQVEVKFTEVLGATFNFTETWDASACALWRATFTYHDSVTPAGGEGSSSCESQGP